MPQKLKILEPAARNKHGQKCVLVQCSCGSTPFVIREDSVKQNRSTSCGFCRKGGRRKTAPVPVAVIAQPTVTEITTDPVSELEYGSVAWIDAHIESKKAAARRGEIRVKELQDSLAVSEVTDLDLLKKWTAESAAFEKLNHQIARLQLQKDKAETAVVKDNRTAAQLVKDRIAALRGSK